MGQGGEPSFAEECRLNKSGMNHGNRKLPSSILTMITVSGKDHGPQGVTECKGVDDLARTKYQSTF